MVEKPQHLAQWKNVSFDELKAYFGMCVIMGLNVLPKVRDYWSNEPLLGNSALKKVMSRNRFEEIYQFLHFSDSNSVPAGGNANYDQLFKKQKVLSAVLENSQRC